MKQIKLGQSGFTVGTIAYGCWRFADSTLQSADMKIRTALDHGLTLIDTADIYGLGEPRGFGGAEAMLGEVLSADPALRDRMVMASKGGIDAVRPYDSTPAYIEAAIDNSLNRLKTDRIDLYQIHRPDLTTPMTDTARALNAAIKGGKILSVGVSNFTVAQTRALQAHLDHPIVATQPQFSAVHQDPVSDGTLDWCMETGATALAWSPLGRGALAIGKSKDATAQRVNEVIARLAETYSASRNQIALAFTLGHGADVIPIIGTQTPDRIVESASAATLPLTARDWYDIVEAYRDAHMP